MSFYLELKLWADQAVEGLNKTREAALLDIGSSIIADTPIDTGLARGNWQASLGDVKTGALERRPALAALAELTNTVASMKGDETFCLVNNLPYATPLEFGHSGQAPAGMVRRHVQRWQLAVSKAAA